LGDIDRTKQLLDYPVIEDSVRYCLETYAEAKIKNSEEKIDELLKSAEGNLEITKLDLLAYLLHETYKTDDLQYIQYDQQFMINQDSEDCKKFLYSELLSEKGVYLLRNSKLDRARLYFTEAIKFKNDIGDEHGIAIIQSRDAIIDINLGKLDTALQTLHSTIPVFEKFEDINNQGLIHNNIGGISFSKGQLIVAKEHFNYGIEIATKKKDHATLGKLLNNLGNVHFELAEYSQALDYYEQSLHYKELAGATSSTAPTLHNIGKIHGRQGDYFLALKYLERSLQQNNDHDPILKANTLSEMINFHAILSEIDQARTYLVELEQLNDNYDLPIINEFYLLSEALILKTNDLAGYKLDAIRKLETIIEGPLLHTELTKIAILNYLELKIEILQLPSKQNIMDLKVYLYHLYKLAQDQSSKYHLIESMLLLSRYHNLIGNEKKSIQLLHQAELMSYEMNYRRLIRRCDKICQDIKSDMSFKGSLDELRSEISMFER